MDRPIQSVPIDRIPPLPHPPRERKAKKDGQPSALSLDEDSPPAQPNTEVRPVPAHEDGVGEQVDFTA